MLSETKTIPTQMIVDSITEKHGVHLYILRLDLNHPTISGNKLFKLKYNLLEAKKEKKNTLLTFGGAFSNHVVAAAAAGKESGFKTIGIIRGEKQIKLNPSLQFATNCGMELHYVSREEYKNKIELNNTIKNNFPKAYTIPEGGSNNLGVKGCEEITKELNIPFDYICTPCGTGATIAGITLSLSNEQKAIGFQILKGENYIKNEVQKWLNKKANNWEIIEDYHFNGYAKVNTELKNFIHQFEQTHKIPLDYIYTGKMMFGIYDLMKKDFFKRGDTIIAVHTGGLQGNEGFNFIK